MKENKRERKTCSDSWGSKKYDVKSQIEKKSETHFYNHKI